MQPSLKAHRTRIWGSKRHKTRTKNIIRSHLGSRAVSTQVILGQLTFGCKSDSLRLGASVGCRGPELAVVTLRPTRSGHLGALENGANGTAAVATKRTAVDEKRMLELWGRGRWWSCIFGTAQGATQHYHLALSCRARADCTGSTEQRYLPSSTIACCEPFGWQPQRQPHHAEIECHDTEYTAIVTRLRSAWDDQDLRDRDI